MGTDSSQHGSAYEIHNYWHLLVAHLYSLLTMVGSTSLLSLDNGLSFLTTCLKQSDVKFIKVSI